MDSYKTPARKYAEGMGEAVADRTVNRIKEDGTRETWADVAHRVALGNSMLAPKTQEREFHGLHHHLRQASILLSGRHLQHGDETQPTRNQEVFTNCSTAAASFLGFYLLLNGSGVGRAYDDHMMVVDWRKMPKLYCTVAGNYPDRSRQDFPQGVQTTEDVLAQHDGEEILIHQVEDSREGWAHAVELVENLTFKGTHHDTVLILDFSGVRPNGSPIRGMQNRPSSGPGPTMGALIKIAELRSKDYAPWLQAMHVDHYLAESVLVGGARRAARMATKDWRDANVLDFVRVKRDGGLWSSNNSVTVDEEFWKLVGASVESIKHESGATQELWAHAKEVFEAVCHHSYHDGTGEPGLINQDKLTANNEGLEVFDDGDIAGSSRFTLSEDSRELMKALLERFKSAQFKMITNPCGEISLTKLGGYCVIADVVPYHAQDLDDATDAFRAATRALIRTNLMDCLYRKEVNRTNRIGVGMTGLHEFAFKFFGYGWKDLVNEEVSKPFWLTLSRFSRAVQNEAVRYSRELGVNAPHTSTTMKPAGTTSKLFGLSEGAHLPAMAEYLRFVQMRNDDPLVQKYRDAGYPVKELVSYPGTTVIGFPTVPEICTLGMGDKLVTASEATPEEQYEYLRLLEKYWIVGVQKDGVTPMPENGNQVSYTLKYDPKVVGYEAFRETLRVGQASIRCCSVMPKADTTAYEYQPETPVTPEEFKAIVAKVQAAQVKVKEDVSFEHIDCGSGACPIDFNEGELEGKGDEPKAEWLVFGKPNCPGCNTAKDLLGKAGQSFEYVDVMQNGGLDWLRGFSSANSVPQIVHQGRLIGGVNELRFYLAGLEDVNFV